MRFRNPRPLGVVRDHQGLPEGLPMLYYLNCPHSEKGYSMSRFIKPFPTLKFNPEIRKRCLFRFFSVQIHPFSGPFCSSGVDLFSIRLYIWPVREPIPEVIAHKLWRSEDAAVP